MNELKTAVIIGWIYPAVVVVIFAWPKIVALLSVGLLAGLVWGWWKERK